MTHLNDCYFGGGGMFANTAGLGKLWSESARVPDPRVFKQDCRIRILTALLFRDPDYGDLLCSFITCQWIKAIPVCLVFETGDLSRQMAQSYLASVHRVTQ